MNYAIEIKNLTKQYTGFTLEDVSFSLPGGTILGLIGENGAGKTTTIKAILGLIRPDGGSVTVLGGSPSDRSVREQLGVVLDECPFHGGLTAETVGKVMAGTYRAWHRELYLQYLDKFELPKNLYLKEFSKGMKMKLSIAAALSHHPRLLIFDEATAGLDPVVRNEILDELQAFLRDEDHSVLLSTHITSDLERVADSITYLHKGRVALTEEKDALLEQYGRLACTAEQLGQVDRAYIVGERRGQFGCEALIRDAEGFRRRYPDLAVERVTLEEIMVLTGKGEAQ
jgi:ABC-2 type transport system ATP-binding protein